MGTLVEAPAAPLRVGWLYDLDACRTPTGVTRHALAQLEALADRPDVELRVVSGRISEPDGRAYWESLNGVLRRELPLRTRDALRYWRVAGWPPLEWWSGPIDWAYSPAESLPATKSARRAVTSHDALQDLRYGGRRRRAAIGPAFAKADLILSVSKFNTDVLLDAFPNAWDRVAEVPNAADDLFYEPASSAEKRAARRDLDLPAGLPYVLSVANFQERKNLPALIRAAASLPEVARGELGLVLVGGGEEGQARALREAIAAIGPRAIVRMPGYRQGRALRAIYAEATALVFPSLCEGFGIPAVEAMAQGVPVALADSTALPEVAGEAGWYFDPNDDQAIAAAVAGLLGDAAERARRVELGKTAAARYRWRASNDRLVAALRG